MGGSEKSMAIQTEVLQKISKKLERVRDYFEGRIRWTPSNEALPGMTALHLTLKTILTVTLGPILVQNGVKPNPAVTYRRVDQVGPGTFNVVLLAKFSKFLDQVSDWLMTHTDGPLSQTDLGKLEALHRVIETTCLALEATLSQNSIDFTPLNPPPAPAEPNVTEIEGGDVRAKLVLDDTEETPVLWTFQGETELHSDAKDALAAFLEQAGLRFSSYELTRFENKVLQWVMARPHGQVLEIKISTLHGRREPYPAYHSKTIEDETDDW